MAVYEVIDGAGVIKPGTKKIKNEAFYKNDELMTIVIPDSVTEIGDRAFQYCENLTEGRRR